MFSRKRALSLLCAACMAASLLCMAKPVPTYADSLSDQLQEARDAQAELEKQIEAIQSDKSKALEEKALLDRQNDKLRSEISLLQQQSDADPKGAGAVRAVLPPGAGGGGAGHRVLLVGAF